MRWKWVYTIMAMGTCCHQSGEKQGAILIFPSLPHAIHIPPFTHDSFPWWDFLMLIVHITVSLCRPRFCEGHLMCSSCSQHDITHPCGPVPLHTSDMPLFGWSCKAQIFTTEPMCNHAFPFLWPVFSKLQAVPVPYCGCIDLYLPFGSVSQTLEWTQYPPPYHLFILLHVWMLLWRFLVASVSLPYHHSMMGIGCQKGEIHLPLSSSHHLLLQSCLYSVPPFLYIVFHCISLPLLGSRHFMFISTSFPPPLCYVSSLRLWLCRSITDLEFMEARR